MEMNAELLASLDRLNPAQRKAVDQVDGPLLVVAGPGTGKTQLLSLRAANILATCDAAPGNILCLTYTDAGAEAMRKRLVELIGRDAYGIQVSTFHGFASFVRSRYPDCFARPASDKLVTDLRQYEIVNDVLKSLPFGSPLASRGREGNAYYARDVLAFVSKVKRSGLRYDTLSRIAQQNIDAAEWLQANTDLCDLVAKKASAQLASEFEEAAERAYALAPLELKQPVVSTPGVYRPYLRYFVETVRNAELVDEDGKTSGYREVRDALFDGSNKDGRTFAIVKQSEKLLAACEAAEQYQAVLDANHLYDFDDMIFDFVHAVEDDPELHKTLQDTYAYIQVDEFQDTNGAQMRMVELLCDGIERPNIMAVGDDDQAIMRFQGATIECINQFVELYHPEVVVLKTNYRSTPVIVELGQKVAAQVERRLPASEGKDITAHRPNEDQLTFAELAFHDKQEEYAAIAASIRERIDAGYVASCGDPNEAIAVIASKHAVLRDLIPYLVVQNVPFAYKQKQNLFTSERMQTMLAMMRCVVALSQGREELAISYLPQIVAAPELGGHHPSSVQFALLARREHRGNWLKAMKETGDARIRGLYDDLVGWSAAAASSPVRELLFAIAVRPLAFYREQAQRDPLAAAEFNAGMRALLAFVEGELGSAAELGRALRLADVVDRLEAACSLGISIDASIDLQAEGAVRLTTAHSSKGLEFDCVYLADADDSTWHKGAQGGGLYPANLLIGDTKDDDDARRLLFVAITRARRHLELYRAGSATLQELSGEVASTEVPSDPLTLSAALETDWHASYRLDTPELLALLDVERDVRHLSASALNEFVTYEEGCKNSLTFPEQRVMRLPMAPQVQFEFGTIVHALMEDVVNQVMGASGRDVSEVVAAHRQKVEWLDFPEPDIEHYLQRYDRIAQTFVPWLIENTSETRRITEASLSVATKAGTPLFGFLDLLLVDDENKTIRIMDYKTGLGKHSISDGYERQLRFYKLMVEASPEFDGYKVTSMGDFYVEPDKETGELRPPFEVTASDAEIAHLEQLIDVVWARIKAGEWDTSAFESSSLYKEAQAEQANFKGGPDKRRVMQRAYEAWLCEQAV